jgi:hypothetical protein
MDLERDLFEERERIVRRGETKRIMQEVLRRVVVGSTGKGDEVWYLLLCSPVFECCIVLLFLGGVC